MNIVKGMNENKLKFCIRLYVIEVKKFSDSMFVLNIFSKLEEFRK